MGKKVVGFLSFKLQPNLRYRNFKQEFLPLDGGGFVVSSAERLGGGERRAITLPWPLPSKGGECLVAEGLINLAIDSLYENASWLLRPKDVIKVE